MPRSGISGLYGNFIFNCLWNIYSVFHSGHTNVPVPFSSFTEVESRLQMGKTMSPPHIPMAESGSKLSWRQSRTYILRYDTSFL